MDPRLPGAQALADKGGRIFGKQSKANRFFTAYVVLMRAPQHYISDPARTGVSFQDLKQAEIGSASHLKQRNDALQQLVWILISLLLSLYLATSCIFWAKATSAWPIFRGF